MRRDGNALPSSIARDETKYPPNPHGRQALIPTHASGHSRRTDKDLAKIPGFIGEYSGSMGRSQSWTRVDPIILLREKTNPAKPRPTHGSFTPARSCMPLRRTTIRQARAAYRCACGHFLVASCPWLSQNGDPRRCHAAPSLLQMHFLILMIM
jgi:hypothetical protein